MVMVPDHRIGGSFSGGTFRRALGPDAGAGYPADRRSNERVEGYIIIRTQWRYKISSPACFGRLQPVSLPDCFAPARNQRNRSRTRPPRTPRLPPPLRPVSPRPLPLPQAPLPRAAQRRGPARPNAPRRPRPGRSTPSRGSASKPRSYSTITSPRSVTQKTRTR
jgi:hypothetical protein